MSAVNIVDVDPAALDREADAVLGSAPSAEPAPDPQSSESSQSRSGGSWEEMTPGLVTLLTFVVFPQWQISAEEQTHVSKATADVLEQVFPGGMQDARWAPWLRLTLVCAGVALARFDAESGFPPLGPRVEKPVTPEPKPADAQQAA
jgi:hypothetical protein